VFSLMTLVLLGCGQSAPTPDARASTPGSRLERVVAVGDLHADLPAALEVLQLAGVADAEGHWTGGSTVLVQTGDTTDRGPDSKEVLELMIRLEAEAPGDGGRVVALLGNHELMNLMGDWRYVSAEDVQDFGSVEARKLAFAPGSELGDWLRARPAAALVDGVVYAHGGIAPDWAERGLEATNLSLAATLAGSEPGLAAPGSPTWYRGYVEDTELQACPRLERALVALGAERMVVGHTTRRDGRIESRCGGRLAVIDTGISSHYGRNAAALELRSGDAWALYPAGPEDLPDP
jgi:hypothetical protein